MPSDMLSPTQQLLCLNSVALSPARTVCRYGKSGPLWQGRKDGLNLLAGAGVCGQVSPHKRRSSSQTDNPRPASQRPRLAWLPPKSNCDAPECHAQIDRRLSSSGFCSRADRLHNPLPSDGPFVFESHGESHWRHQAPAATPASSCPGRSCASGADGNHWVETVPVCRTLGGISSPGVSMMVRGNNGASALSLRQRTLPPASVLSLAA